MGRKTARRTHATGPLPADRAAPLRPRSRWRRRARWLALPALVALAILGLTLLRGRPAAVVPPGAAQTMDATAADSQGYLLVLRGRYQESLPYYRRVLQEVGTQWMAHANYSSALHNAASESRLHLGRLEPAVRSSWERIALIALSLEEEDVAEFHARDEHDRAIAVYLRGQTLQTWGFPLDALADYRRALELAPGDSAIRQVVGSLTDLLARGGAE